MMEWFRRHLLKASDSKTPNLLQSQSKSKGTDEDEQQIYGITDELINHIKSFTIDTFKNYPLQEEDGSTYDVEAQLTSAKVADDLSEWQEKHAILILSRVKEISQLRYLLCPGRMKEKLFWKIYFKLTRSYLVEYELRAVQREKLKTMATEDEKSKSSDNNIPYEVEMSEAKHGNYIKPLPPSSS